MYVYVNHKRATHYHPMWHSLVKIYLGCDNKLNTVSLFNNGIRYTVSCCRKCFWSHVACFIYGVHVVAALGFHRQIFMFDTADARVKTSTFYFTLCGYYNAV